MKKILSRDEESVMMRAWDLDLLNIKKEMIQEEDLPMRSCAFSHPAWHHQDLRGEEVRAPDIAGPLP